MLTGITSPNLWLLCMRHQMLETILTIVSAEISLIGKTASHIVNLKMIMRIYVYLLASGNRSTISMCKLVNHVSSLSNFPGVGLVCLWILYFWDSRPVCVQFFISTTILAHMKHLQMALVVAHVIICGHDWSFFLIIVVHKDVGSSL